MGREGAIYKIRDGLVMKITSRVPLFYYKALNKNIDGCVRIYAIGTINPPKKFLSDLKISKMISGSEDRLYYVIMEELYTSEYFNNEVTKIFKTVTYPSYLKYMRNDIKEDVDISIYDGLVTAIDNVSTLIDYSNMDIHSANFMYDRDGNVRYTDLGSLLTKFMDFKPLIGKTYITD